MSNKAFIKYEHPVLCSQKEMLKRSQDFYQLMCGRRTVRNYKSGSIPRELIENCVRTAASAPSGANMQPWHFVIVSDQDVKRKIRVAAEAEEKEFYEKKAPAEWLEALRPLGTDSNKPFLEEAPYLIVIFEKKFHQTEEGKIIKHYYTRESVGIATGMLITALHNAGLASLTHTPSPMNFLNDILGRPGNEKPYLILVTGLPSENTEVPDIQRKETSEVCTFI